MAERIARLTPARRGRPHLYPWDTWTDGHAWRIEHGEDFQTSAANMCQLVRQYAARNGYAANASVHGDAVEFQFERARVEGAA